ncbi:hypothetical protein LEP1GSC013_1424 [Leptospira interrogans serovar Valbuzzi str. Duyster]|nr:hypothetical protein LEP1GSC013_1424 [Leptospira interrogans serovar Valbuzzi str. Duyster]ENO71559.1 hypothetical protein LEP1GSC012_0272 [Leptospira interrogans serovar Valbuzzi str. Valbuzzi]
MVFQIKRESFSDLCLVNGSLNLIDWIIPVNIYFYLALIKEEF